MDDEMTQLSEHFTLEEMTVSESAARLGIRNTPGKSVIRNLQLLCVNSLEPIREIIGAPIIVTSGYRSMELNSVIGGAVGSQHTLGQAADIICPGLSQEELFSQIRRTSCFDQLIDEFSSWVHVSYRYPNIRRDVLTARRRNGEVVYKLIGKG